jgi:threonine aldolase
MNSTIDLRSDTVTVPTAEMLEAMARAALGDDVFGEDPTVNQLQAKAADIFGMEDALFVPSGTMANQLALLTHCQRGDEVLVGRGSHTVTHESGGGAVLAGVQLTVLDESIFDGDAVLASVRQGDVHYAPTALVAIENSHNRAGGRVFTVDRIRSIREACDRAGLGLHMDGARVFNATTADGTDPKVFGALMDSISFCLSKGLGCPIGSLLLGAKPWISRARRYRKMLGGGMRQSGVIAAAGIYALDHHVERLADDHRRARAFAESIGAVAGVKCGSPETNIVMFEIDPGRMSAADFQREAKSQGLLAFAAGPNTVRAVFHLGISDEAAQRAAKVVTDVVNRTMR